MITIKIFDGHDGLVIENTSPDQLPVILGLLAHITKETRSNLELTRLVLDRLQKHGNDNN